MSQDGDPYLITVQLLDKEGLATVPQLHVQVHRLSVDFNVHLQWEWWVGTEWPWRQASRPDLATRDTHSCLPGPALNWLELSPNFSGPGCLSLGHQENIVATSFCYFFPAPRC